MPTVEFKIAKQTYQLICSEGEQQHIINLASVVNTKVKELSKTLGSASDNTLIAITSIMMQDEIETLKNQPKIVHKNQTNPENKFTEKDLNKALTNSLEPIANSLEKLANKLNKY